jgi:hypothetical protein
MAASVITAAFRQNYCEYSDAARQELLDGLERIARDDTEHAGQNRRRMTAAFSVLAVIALDPTITAPEAGEIPIRLLRIYRESAKLAANEKSNDPEISPIVRSPPDRDATPVNEASPKTNPTSPSAMSLKRMGPETASTATGCGCSMRPQRRPAWPR